jgi:putative transposase
MSTSNSDSLRLRLVRDVLALAPTQLGEVAEFLDRLRTSAPCIPLHVTETLADRDWPHAPLHRLGEQGTYIVTSGTYEKAHLFRGADRLDYLETNLLSLAKAFNWQLEAWAVFSNHYHFVAHSPPNADNLKEFTQELHSRCAAHVNRLDGLPGRQVWFNYWETSLTFERSYLARLSYVHRNPVKHGLVSSAEQYRWCSAAWLARTASPSQVKMLYSFKINAVRVEDEFDPV